MAWTKDAAATAAMLAFLVSAFGLAGGLQVFFAAL
jgi:hypothetical protein